MKTIVPSPTPLKHGSNQKSSDQYRSSIERLDKDKEHSNAQVNYHYCTHCYRNVTPNQNCNGDTKHIELSQFDYGNEEECKCNPQPHLLDPSLSSSKYPDNYHTHIPNRLQSQLQSQLQFPQQNDPNFNPNSNSKKNASSWRLPLTFLKFLKKKVKRPDDYKQKSKRTKISDGKDPLHQTATWCTFCFFLILLFVVFLHVIVTRYFAFQYNIYRAEILTGVNERALQPPINDIRMINLTSDESCPSGFRFLQFGHWPGVNEDVDLANKYPTYSGQIDRPIYKWRGLGICISRTHGFQYAESVYLCPKIYSKYCQASRLCIAYDDKCPLTHIELEFKRDSNQHQQTEDTTIDTTNDKVPPNPKSRSLSTAPILTSKLLSSEWADPSTKHYNDVDDDDDINNNDISIMDYKITTDFPSTSSIGSSSTNHGINANDHAHSNSNSNSKPKNPKTTKHIHDFTLRVSRKVEELAIVDFEVAIFRSFICYDPIHEVPLSNNDAAYPPQARKQEQYSHIPKQNNCEKSGKNPYTLVVSQSFLDNTLRENNIRSSYTTNTHSITDKAYLLAMRQTPHKNGYPAQCDTIDVNGYRDEMRISNEYRSSILNVDLIGIIVSITACYFLARMPTDHTLFRSKYPSFTKFKQQCKLFRKCRRCWYKAILSVLSLTALAYTLTIIIMDGIQTGNTVEKSFIHFGWYRNCYDDHYINSIIALAARDVVSILLILVSFIVTPVLMLTLVVIFGMMLPSDSYHKVLDPNLLDESSNSGELEPNQYYQQNHPKISIELVENNNDVGSDYYSFDTSNQIKRESGLKNDYTELKQIDLQR